MYGVKMKVKAIFIFYFLCFVLSNFGYTAVLKHNTIQEIENCKGKLKLQLVRVWGGEEEEDENKFFKTPKDVAVDLNNKVYICDQDNHFIKVFDFSGQFIQTVGVKGKGPGDLYWPWIINFFSNGDLLVFEMGGRRFQWFNKKGKSNEILKYKGSIMWYGVTSKDEIVIYDRQKTFSSRKLVSVINKKGKVLKTFGKYLDKSSNYSNSEIPQFTIDKNGYLYAANVRTPLIRKYSPEGKLLVAITFETPFKIPVKISLNSIGDEIEIKGEVDKIDKEKVIGMKGGIAIQSNTGGKKIKFAVCQAIATNSKKMIFIISDRRLRTEEEVLGMRIIGGPGNGINRAYVNYDIVKNIDLLQLLVFSPEGKIIAQTPMTTLSDDIKIYNNRLFVLDGYYNQRILECEMIFKD